MLKHGKFMLLSALLLGFVFALVYAGVTLTSDFGKTKQQADSEDAAKRLSKLYANIAVSEAEPVKGQIDLNPADVAESLPDISKFPVTVSPTTDRYAEIFSSTEKAGEGVNGWLAEAAEAFNRAGIEVAGSRVSVQIRNIASGTAADYIKSGKYMPDAFTPSNELWGKMVEASGVQAELVTERLAGNVAGIVIAKPKYEALIERYGSVNVKTVTEAIANNELAMGYTDPFASSTGLNFLVTSLHAYDSSDLLSEAAVQGFETFQANVPFIASTTIQMREAAKSGMLDGFVLEYQTYANAADLKSGYAFTPFGFRHDNPLYALGDLPDYKRDIIEAFARFVQRDDMQRLAAEKGFNGLNDYKPEMEGGGIDGSLLASAQQLWKEKKNGSRPIAAVFVTDVSGSMAGEPLNRLKESLIKGQKYLGKDNSIGLESYSDDVTIQLPIAKYDTNQQSLFVGAVNGLQASGGTATFDGIIVALKLLQDELAANPETQPIIFVLSDGETNEGYSLKDIRGLVETFGIPIYTIGYNANIEALQSISSINEAASINADTDDVVYKIGNLFNVQM